MSRLMSLNSMVLSSMNGGLVGAGRCSFPTSISSALDMVGRSEGISWVHKSPT